MQVLTELIPEKEDGDVKDRVMLARRFCFGPFEVDLRARELRRRGVRLRLEEKPFQILELLLERAGEVVSRRELRERLWPHTHVAFERNLNTAVNRLRNVLGDSAANPRFIETRSRRGYRLIAPVEVRNAHPNVSKRSIAVLPFQNSSDHPEMEYLSDGITESLIDSLSQLPEIRVIARSTVFCYKGKQIDPRTLGRDLNVACLLTGRIVQRGDTLEIDAELVEAESGWRLWGGHYDAALSDVFAAQQSIAQEIWQDLRLWLSQDDWQKPTARHTENDDKTITE